MPCKICPRGYMDKLPCPGCDCPVSASVPAPMCGRMDQFLPCYGCVEPCAYAERASDLRQMEAGGFWWNGNEEGNPWAEVSTKEEGPLQEPPGWLSQWDGEVETPVNLEAHLTGLNDDQRKVALHVQRPCVVIAGAGSGKTKSVVSRIQNLIRVERVHPGDILAITFTRKAANEMRERAMGALNEDEGLGLQIRTFHSVGVQICRSNARILELKERFSIWDEDAAKRQAKVAVQEVLEDSGDPDRKRSYTPGMLLDVLGSWKERGLELDIEFWMQLDGGDGAAKSFGLSTVKTMQEKISEAMPYSSTKGEIQGRLEEELDELKRAIRRYENLKRVVGALDLTDLIWVPVTRARKDPRVAKALGDRWAYIIVDEYQDTNDLQEELIALLGGERRNVMVVGDDDQSIYGWRGSNVSLITGFTKRWSGSSMIRLGQNYRCRPEIVMAADAAIQNNENRVEKRLWSERPSGGSVRIFSTPAPWDESSLICKEIKKKIGEGVSPSDIAVLSRLRLGVSIIAAELSKMEIPCEAVGVKPWYKQQDVENVLSHLRYQSNPEDLDAAQQILTSWPGIGATTIKNWQDITRHGDQMLDAPLASLLLLPRHGEKTKKGQDIKRLRELHIDLRQEIEQMQCGQICKKILDCVGISGEILEDLGSGVTRKADEARKRKDAVDQLLDCANRSGKSGHEGLAEMMDNISTLISVQDAAVERVTVSTVHSAKGLEWGHVFVMGLNQGVFPSGSNLEEERRLFYVAATRARDNLTLTYSLRIRNHYGELMPSEASMFIHEAEAAGTAVRGWE